MAAHAHHSEPAPEDRIKLRESSGMLMIIGIVAAAAGVAMLFLGNHPTQRVLFSYLMAWVFFTTMALGALFAVVVHHASRAGWNVTIRRTSENIAATLPILWLLSIPLLISIINQKGTIYMWAIPPNSPQLGIAEGDSYAHEGANTDSKHEEAVKAADQQNVEQQQSEEEEFPPTAQATHAKRTAEFAHGPVFEKGIKWKRDGAFAWYSNAFFFLRIFLYFATLSGIALWFRRTSIRQDHTGDKNLTLKMQSVAPVCLVIMGLAITFLTFDLIMSLDPHWYSTMFGVYVIAGSILSGFATIIIAVYLLQALGYLRGSISIEHYHDLGKYLFGFTFFFGYIAFGQYMLLWYSSIPEEVSWYSRHGASTQHPSNWSGVIIAILFGQFCIPFLGLLSRHVKRNKTLLFLWAIWVLVFHLVDAYWMVMPEYGALNVSVVDLGALLIFGGLFLAVIVWNMSRADLRPTHDPRLKEALAFTNI